MMSSGSFLTAGIQSYGDAQLYSAGASCSKMILVACEGKLGSLIQETDIRFNFN